MHTRPTVTDPSGRCRRWSLWHLDEELGDEIGEVLEAIDDERVAEIGPSLVVQILPGFLRPGFGDECVVEEFEDEDVVEITGLSELLHLPGKGYCKYTEPGGDILAGKCLTPAIKWGGNCQKHSRK